MRNLYTFFSKFKHLTALLLFVFALSPTGYAQETGSTNVNLRWLQGSPQMVDVTTTQVATPCDEVTEFSVTFVSNDFDYTPYIINVETPDGNVYDLGQNYTVGGSVFSSGPVSETGGTWIVRVYEPNNIQTGNLAVVRIDYTYNMGPTTQPVALCQDYYVRLDANNSGHVYYPDTNAGSTGCGITYTLDETILDLTDLGLNVITQIVTDREGKTDQCTSNVYVYENNDPVIAACQDIRVVLDENNQATITAQDVNFDHTLLGGMSSVLTGPMTMEIDIAQFDINDLGDNTVTLTVTDGNGVSETCTSTVTVVDEDLPVAACQDITVQLDANNQATITASQIDNGSTVPQGTTMSLSLDVSTFDETNVGPNTVTLTVSDGTNTDQCTATVTVANPNAITAVCQDITVRLDANNQATITADQIDNGSSVPAGEMTLSLDVTAFDETDLGDNPVVLTVSDGTNQETCTATVTVLSAAGTLESGTTRVNFNWLNGSAAMVDTRYGNVATTCDEVTEFTVTFESNNFDYTPYIINVESPDGTVYQLGPTYTVGGDVYTSGPVSEPGGRWTVRVYEPNNIQTGTLAVVRIDYSYLKGESPAPVAICKDYYARLDADNFINVFAPEVNNGSTGCGLTLAINETDFDLNDLGANPVTLTVTDRDGQVATCNAVIYIYNANDIIAACKDITVPLDENNQATITAADVNYMSSVPAGTMNLSIDVNQFDINDLGDNPVVLSVSDGQNTATCTSTVTVVDTDLPVALCQDITVQLDENNQATITPQQVDAGSSVPEGLTMQLSLDVSTFDATDIGANTVILTVSDGTNTATCTSTVTVLGNGIITAACQDVTVQLDANNQATVTAQEVDNGSSVPDGATMTLQLSQTQFDATDVGANTVTLTVSDGTNTATCTATVTVVPFGTVTALCQDITVMLDANGQATIAPEDVNNGSSVHVGQEMNLSLNVNQFDETNIGANLVVLTVSDDFGSATCNATVTVEEWNGITTVCNDITVQLDATTNLATITAEEIDGGSSVNPDATMSLSIDVTQFDCTDVGENTVTLTVSDNANNSATCQATVTVEDPIDPVAACQDLEITLDAFGNAVITAADIDNGSSDNCGIATRELNITTFNSSNTGANTVILTVIDGSGNSATCTSTVTVINPGLTITCKDTTLYLDQNNAASLQASNLLGSTDAAPDANVVYALSISQFDCSMIGENEVVLTADPATGNISNCVSVVTVVDTVKPVATCQDITVNLDATGTATILASQINNGSTDNCGIESMHIDQNEFNCNTIGENLVQLTVTDESGNIGRCTATVTVVDPIPPIAVCENVTLTLDANGVAPLLLDDIDGGSTDNCAIALRTASIQRFTCADVGDHSVTLTVTDFSGNTSTCTSTVTVVDDTPSGFSCTEATVYLRDNGVLVLSTAQIAAISGLSQDNCASADDYEFTISQRLFTCEDAGERIPVSLTATDAQGVVFECSTFVTVLDTIAPVAMCVDTVEVYLDENGSAIVNADQVMTNDEADNCEPYAATLSTSIFGCAEAGANTVTLSVIDQSDNTGTCTTVVMVHDTIAPVVEAMEDIMVDLEEGVCDTVIEYPVPSVMDNCTELTFELIEGLGQGGTFTAGTTTETWMISDPAGNSATVSFNVVVTTVNDAPAIDPVDDVLAQTGSSPLMVDLTGISSGDDCVDQPVTITAESSNDDLITNIDVNYIDGSSTGSLSLTLAEGMSGEAEVIITVEDVEGAMVADTFMVTVSSVDNQPPVVVTPIPDTTVIVSRVLNIPISSILGELFDDPEGEELEIEVMLANGDPLPGWLVFDGTIDTLTATPALEDTGCYTVVVVATDPGSLTATDTFEVCVERSSAVGDFELETLDVVLYPNPTKGLVNVDIKSSTIADLDLSVMDITGRVILQRKYSAAERISFDLKDNVSGMYFVRMQFDGKQVLKKLILNRE